MFFRSKIVNKLRISIYNRSFICIFSPGRLNTGTGYNNTDAFFLEFIPPNFTLYKTGQSSGFLVLILLILLLCFVCLFSGNSDKSAAWDTGQNSLKVSRGFFHQAWVNSHKSPELELQRNLVDKRMLDSIRFRAGIGLGKRLSLLKELQKNIQTTADLIRKTKSKITNDLTSTKDMLSKITSKFPPYNADWHSSFPNPVVSKSKVRAKLQKADTLHDSSHLDPVVYWIGIGRR